MLKSCCTIILVLLLSFSCSLADISPVLWGIAHPYELLQKIRAQSILKSDEGRTFVHNVTQDIFGGESKRDFSELGSGISGSFKGSFRGSWEPQLSNQSAILIAVDNSTLTYHASNIPVHAFWTSHNSSKMQEFIAELVVGTICHKRGEKNVGAPRKIKCGSIAELKNVPFSQVPDAIKAVKLFQIAIASSINRGWEKLLIDPTNRKIDGERSRMSSVGETLRAAWIHKLLPAVNQTEATEFDNKLKEQDKILKTWCRETNHDMFTRFSYCEDKSLSLIFTH